MQNSIQDKILKWSKEEEGNKFVLLNTFIRFLGDNLFYDYEPCLGPFPDFNIRLNKWLNNTDDDIEQKLLFELVSKIFYIGREEFISLHKTAYNTNCKNWIFENNELNFDLDDYQNILNDELEKCWFCPVTDSFRINQFYHINNIHSTHTFRPDWRSLKKFGDKDTIKQYIRINNVKYLILLEDFVGTATQSIPVLKFAVSLDLEIPILFIPMIIYPEGLKNINENLKEYSDFYLRPIIAMDESELVNNLEATPDSFIKTYSDLSYKIYQEIKESLGARVTSKILEFGYKNTGGLTVMYSNTPNNSLPILHVESSKWEPLFKRHSRD